MKFPYKKIAPGVERPVIPIELSYGDKTIRYFALIDSGADVCLFQPEIGSTLGIDIEKGKGIPVSGIVEGDRRVYHMHPVTIGVGGWKYENINVGFMPDLARIGYGILGQRGFFDQFRNIKFEKRKNTVELNI